MSTATQNRLRPDVAAVVDAHARRPRGRGCQKWEAYDQFKSNLSRACGWDAPPERYDQNQYDAGIAAYLQKARI